MIRRLIITATLCWSFVALPASRPPVLAPERTKSGAALLDAFSSIAAVTRKSIVLLRVDDRDAALGAVIDSSGLVLTKASEIVKGKLSCHLSSGDIVKANWLASDDENDLALVKVEVSGLKPIDWAADDVTTGRWVVTPGIESTPEAVGIVSATPRRILPKRAVIGVLPDFSATTAKVREVMPGLGADNAGMKSGDVIVSVNTKAVKDGEDLVKILRNFREGQTVKLRVQRGDEQLEIDVQMALPKLERLGRGFDRQDRMNRLGGEISRRAEGFQLAIQHDTVLQPWQCGGPLVNLEGKALGLNIARAGRIASYALPASLVQQLIFDLKRQTEVPVKQEETQIR